jgi:hypothetical protein
MLLPRSDCAEQQTLWERYNTAVIAYWEMVAALESASTPSEFVEARDRAESVRLLFARAVNDLSNHIQGHGCTLGRKQQGRLRVSIFTRKLSGTGGCRVHPAHPQPRFALRLF